MHVRRYSFARYGEMYDKYKRNILAIIYVRKHEMLLLE